MVAIELVLAHAFDEDVPAPRSAPRAEFAQSVRETYLLELTGLGAGRGAQEPSSPTGTEVRQPTVRARGMVRERRAPRGRAATTLR